jgi:hypothetical protein
LLAPCKMTPLCERETDRGVLTVRVCCAVLVSRSRAVLYRVLLYT